MNPTAEIDDRFQPEEPDFPDDRARRVTINVDDVRHKVRPVSWLVAKLKAQLGIHVALNWTGPYYILGRKWVSWSWRDVSPKQSAVAILAGHLEAFNK